MFFKEQVDIKLNHSKVSDIVHTNLNTPQEYLKSSTFSNKESSLLFNLRCRLVNEFKGNFQNSDQHVLCFVCKQL